MPGTRFWIDGHLDLAYLAVAGRNVSVPTPEGSDACLSLPALREGGVALFFGTIYTEPADAEREAPFDTPKQERVREPQVYDRDDVDSAHDAGVRQLRVYEELERRGELTIVRSAGDLTRDAPLPKVMILMEGADPIRSAEEVGWWHARGLRMVGLTWALGSRYAGGNSTGGPLTSAGREMVATLDEYNILHDASHLSDRAFWDLLETTNKLVVASHSNSRAVMGDDNQRHLSDDQIRAIDERGGIVGLNLFSKFLAKGRRATIDDCLRHVEHICDVMGHRRGIGLGSDMDGGFAATQLAEGVDHPGKLDALADALRGAGWSDEDIDGFTHRNWLRILESVLARD